MRKKIVALFLSTSLVLIPFGNQKNVFAGNEQSNMSSNLKIEIPAEHEYTIGEKRLTEQAIDKAKVSGTEAARLVNKIKDESAFEKSVSDVLDVYYADDNNISKELENFAETVDIRATSILEDYEDALEERKNADSLDYVPGGIMVLFDAAVSDSDIQEIISTVSDGGEIITGMYETSEELPEYKKEKIRKADEMVATKSVWVRLRKSQTTEMAISEYQKMSCVVSASVNGLMEMSVLDINDEYAEYSWHLDRVNLAPAWASVNAANNSRIIKVAVIDTGVDMEQPDLKANLIRSTSADITGDTPVLLRSLSKPYVHEHGTQVAGIIAAEANNTIGVAGIAGISNDINGFKCKIVAIQAYTLEADGYRITNENFEKAVRYAVSKGVDVINISANTYVYSEQLKEVIDYAYEAGITVVASAGNHNTDQSSYPSDLEHVISVIGTDPDNVKVSSSNYGIQKDISAPGFSIYSTFPNNEYKARPGTSFAAPIVSATAAMMKGVNDNLTPDEIDSIIKVTATDIGSEGVDEETAYGLINTGLAVQKAKHKTFSDRTPVLKGISSVGTGNVSFWCDTIANEEEYVLYRSTSENGTFEQVGRYMVNGASRITFSETGLTSGVTYYYKVRCRCKYSTGSKYSLYSETVSCKIS